MKPILVADGIDNKFIERDRSVSISIDKPKLFIDSSFKAYIQIEPDTISGMTG